MLSLQCREALAPTPALWLNDFIKKFGDVSSVVWKKIADGFIKHHKKYTDFKKLNFETFVEDKTFIKYPWDSSSFLPKISGTDCPTR
jgi:hypothetical protein